MKLAGSLVLAMTALVGTAAQAQTVNVKIGVMNDMSSLYADIGGQGSVVAAKMAVDDFNAAAHGLNVEICQCRSSEQAGRRLQHRPAVVRYRTCRCDC